MQLQIHSKYNKEQGIHFAGPLKEVLDPVFLLLVLGRPGSGKSTILKSLLTNQKFLSKKFQRIIYVTPTKIQHQHMLFNQLNWNRDFDQKWIDQKIDDAKKDGITKLLFVFDDTISKWGLKQNRAFIKNFIWNRRHLLHNGSISIIITSQRYNALPTDVRSSLTNIIVFNQTNKQAELIYGDSNSSLEKHEMKHHLTNLKKGEYLYLNCISGKCFDKKLKIVS